VSLPGPKAWAVAAVVAALLAALGAGAHRTGALVGAALSGATGLVSIQAMGRFAAGARPVQQALAVMVIGFLARIVLVSVGTIVVVRTGESVPGFVAGFFVVFFALAAIEGAYVQRLGRRTGSSA
jgi:hypothetical protein